MLACKDIHEQMNDAADGQLSFIKRVLYRLHVALCPPCRRSHESICSTLGLLHKMRDCAPVMDDDDEQPQAKS